ncbi:MAG: bifunctional nuclease family protein [Parachlamydiaceae bacterium]|nr:bifunctional nuclease family protein [Parachlamydiaceae bacterium]
MLNELIQLTFDKIMQTRAYTVVILGAHDKRFAIYTDPGIGKTIQMYLTGIERPRPLTHDLLHNIFRGFGIRVKQVVINDVQETIYYARLFLELEDKNGVKQILEIDARPSDCIMLALMNNVPVYCTRDVLNKTIKVDD